MMNTMMRNSPNLAIPVPRRNEEARDEEVDNDDNGIINPPAYSPEYSVARPISSDDLNSLPLAPAVLIEENDIHSAEEERLPTQNNEKSNSRKNEARLDPFRSIHPRCNHISCGCLTMIFLVFVGMAVLLKTYLPDILPSSITRRYEEKKLVASDGSGENYFGYSCSISDELVVAGAPWVDDKKGAAYLFYLDGTEVKKLTPGTLNGDYVQVFSRNGTYERTIRCDDWVCDILEIGLATHGNLIVLSGRKNFISKLLIYSIEGQFLKPLLGGPDRITDVAISKQFIVWTGKHKTFIYSNTPPGFPKIAEIEQGGKKVSVSSDRLVIGDWQANGYDGAVWLYKIDRTPVTALDRQDASSWSLFGWSVDITLLKSLDRHDSTIGSLFGWSVDITDDKVLVSAPFDDDQGEYSGSVFIYSAVTGEFIQKIPAPDGEAEDEFGSSVCASDSHYIVGARGDNSRTGAAYLFQFPEN